MVDMKHHMIVVTRDGICGDIGGKDTGQCQQAVFEPLSALFVAVAAKSINTAKKGAANAA